MVTANRNRKTRGICRVDLAYAELASSTDARDINRDVVLELIRTKQPVSRADLSRISGLQPSIISLIVERRWRPKSSAPHLPASTWRVRLRLAGRTGTKRR